MIGSPIGDVEPSPRMSHLFQLFDQAAQGNLPRNGAYPSIPLGTPTHAPSFGGPLRHPATPATRLHPANGAHISPRTDASGSRTSGDGPSPVGSLKGSGGAGSGRPVSSGRSHLSGVIQEDQEDDVIEMPKQQHTHYDGEPLGVTPAFADTPAWLTEATTAAIPIYHRQSSDGAALRLMVEALGAQNGARFDGDSQDPLDSTPRPATGSKNNVLDDEAQQSPFGTLLIPPQSDSINDYAVRLRRSTTVMPHWTQTPRILVVEDDVVYRQLSSKFLEKFGCVTETVDDAQGAVEKMNRTKYDLVLMDIFFGPSMDG